MLFMHKKLTTVSGFFAFYGYMMFYILAIVQGSFVISPFPSYIHKRLVIA